MSWEGGGKGGAEERVGPHLLWWGRTGTLSQAGGARQRFKYGMLFNAMQVLKENLKE